MNESLTARLEAARRNEKELCAEHTDLKRLFESAPTEAIQDAYRLLVRSCRQRLKECSDAIKELEREADLEAQQRRKSSKSADEKPSEGTALRQRLATAERNFRQTGAFQYATEASVLRRELKSQKSSTDRSKDS